MSYRFFSFLENIVNCFLPYVLSFEPVRARDSSYCSRFKYIPVPDDRREKLIDEIFRIVIDPEPQNEIYAGKNHVAMAFDIKFIPTLNAVDLPLVCGSLQAGCALLRPANQKKPSP